MAGEKQTASISGNAGIVTLETKAGPVDVLNLTGIHFVAHVFERASGGLILVVTDRGTPRARVEATFGGAPLEVPL